MKKLVSFLFVLLLMVACGKEQAPVVDQVPSSEQPAEEGSAETPPKTRSETPEGKPAWGTIRGLEMGDVACYIVLDTPEGEEAYEMADFALCEDLTTIGKDYNFEWQQIQVLADSCEGNPDCQESQMEWLIVGLTPVI